MATELAVIEPIQPPDLRRPGMLPSLPAWAERLSGAVRLELQPTLDGKSFERSDVPVLPANLMPTEAQRQAMTNHLGSLRSSLQETPQRSAEAETRVATAVSKLITVLAGERKSDLVEEARSEVYLDVMEDVPCWAVESAVRRWFRHDCGTDERGKPHNYVFAPDPGTLRKIAQEELYGIGARMTKLQKVLEARQYVDCSKQIEAGRAAMRGLHTRMKEGRITEALSFQEAVEIGSKVPEQSERAEAAE